MKPFAGLYGMVDVPPVGGQAVPSAAESSAAESSAAVSSAAVSLARALLDAGVGIVQLRMKGATAAAMLAACDALVALCRAHDATFIVNDRLDVAVAAGADGVHLGQDDLPLAAARRVAPAGFVIGVSTHSEAQARAAAAGGADYIGFGPCFATSSKLNPDPVVGLDALRQVCALPLPVVAIGGITLDTVADVARAGARAAAIIRAVNAAPDVTAAARRVMAAFPSGSPTR